MFFLWRFVGRHIQLYDIAPMITELALGMRFLELHHIFQCLCVYREREKDGVEGNLGS